jgi:hypothetical protein
VLGAIAPKGLTMSELFDSSLHRIDCRTRERLGDVPDSAADQPLGRLRIGFAKFAHPPSDFWEEIACLKPKIVLV